MSYSDIVIVTLSGGEHEIEFHHSHNFYHIQNLGSGSVQISVTPDISGRTDGVIEIPSGGSATIPRGKNNKFYVYGSGKINIAASDSNVNPFRNSSKGGGGGGTGVSSYPQLTDLPSINGHTLLGNMASEDLGISGGSGGTIAVDDFISLTSINPVQNKVIYQELVKLLAEAEGYTDEQIAALINGAPSTLDTLDKIAQAMADNQDIVEALHDAVGSKADKNDLEAHIHDYNNPHRVNKADVGLDRVDNTPDAEKDVRSAGKLTKPTTINGIEFDGSKPIKIPTSGGADSTINTVKVNGNLTFEDLGWNRFTANDAINIVKKAFEQSEQYTIIAEIPLHDTIDGHHYTIDLMGGETQQSVNDGLKLTTNSWMLCYADNDDAWRFNNVDVTFEFDFKNDVVVNNTWLFGVMFDTYINVTTVGLYVKDNELKCCKTNQDKFYSLGSSASFADGLWHHVKLIFTDSRKHLDIFIDGKSEFSIQLSSGSSSYNCRHFHIGCFSKNGTSVSGTGYGGYIKNIKVEKPKE